MAASKVKTLAWFFFSKPVAQVQSKSPNGLNQTSNQVVSMGVSENEGYPTISRYEKINRENDYSPNGFGDIPNIDFQGLVWESR